MWRIQVLLCLLATWAGATTIIGDFPGGFALTRAELVMPDVVEKGYYGYAEDSVSNSYRFTITGGDGTGLLLFDGMLSGHENHDAVSYYQGTTQIFAPFRLDQYGHGPLWCSGFTCPPVEFQFGVPFVLRFQAASRAEYSHYGDSRDMSGVIFTAETWLGIHGVTDANYNHAGATVYVETIENPEPGTIAMMLGGIALIALSRRRLRG